MKHFWLIRHAKSEDSPPGPGLRDIDRDLNKRGRRNGEQVQRWFTQISQQQPECRADWLVTSSATRALATSQFVAQGFALASDQQVSDPQLYLAGPEILLDALRSTPSNASCVALVAHNPGLTWLVNALSDPTETLDNLPTLGCALFRTEASDWADITQAERLRLVTPKTLR